MNIKLNELLNKQLDNIPENKKLSEKDLKRILKYTENSIFDKDNCTLWKGFVTTNKGTYINFYHNGKKTALHRLLYCNFVSSIFENTYLKFTCNSEGKCCNINHIIIKKNNIINYNNNINNHLINFNI